MIVTKLDIPCIWGGTLAGVLLKNDTVTTDRLQGTTVRIVGIHGWLDNLNSLLPLAEKLIDRHPNYEIYLFDGAGHGFSSHLPKGFSYTDPQNFQDLRTIVQTLGWNKGKFSIIGHSYGAMLGLLYAASYPQEVLCYVAIDTLLREYVALELYWKSIGARLDRKLQTFPPSSKTYKEELTFEKTSKLIQSTRPGITDSAARLLTERSVRRDADNKLYFTRDASLKNPAMSPYTHDMIRNAITSLKASVLFIGSSGGPWTKSSKTVDLLKEHNPNFELTVLDGSHHLHMTNVDAVVDRIEQYFNKYLPPCSLSVIENSKL